MRERPICCDGADCGGSHLLSPPRVILHGQYTLSRLLSLPSRSSLPPTGKKIHFAHAKYPHLDHCDAIGHLSSTRTCLGARLDLSALSFFALSLSRSPSLPPLFLPQSDGPNERARAPKRAQENREDKRAPFFLGRPTARARARASSLLFLASCGMVDSKRRKDGKSRGERERPSSLFCRCCAR